MSIFLLPETRGLDIDSDDAVSVHKSIILKKAFLKNHYLDQYALFARHAEALQELPGKFLELGSGGGFLKDVLPDVITSDVAPYPNVDTVALADHLPFGKNELKGIFLLNVLHHLPEPNLFFKEAQRCLTKGGRIVMVEPFNSLVGRFIYKNFHHEPFDETQVEWKLQGTGRLTSSNQALPWIIFWRDLDMFKRQFPDLTVTERTPHTLLCYALSGGLSMRALAPAFSYPFFRSLDAVLAKFPRLFPLLQTLVIEKK